MGEYVFLVTIVQDEPLDAKNMIDKIFDTALENSGESAGVIVGPYNANSDRDFELVRVSGLSSNGK